ncbi:MAG: sugar phosphate isomerase/epimerase [Prevotellaceae bacterium]|jgi:sugar phosphate isomerase/epimerase|nr:sugar phosphate isomerase/epimerase [Prevotellaceae bacterium]
MKNRREFLKTAAFAVAGGLVLPNLLSSCSGGASSVKKHIGLQLYSLRDDINDIGIKKVLETVAKMGYVNLETAGYSKGKIYDTDPAEFKKMVDDLGMRVTSAHLGRGISDNPDEDMQWWNVAVEAHQTAGMKYMIMPFSPLSGEGATIDNVKRYGEYFSKIGLITAAANIKFGYHNHAFEFENKIDDVPVYDLLVENTSPDHVLFQNDVYWTQKGGYDPVKYLKKYPKRIQVLHIKDETAIGASGTIDFKTIFETAYANGIKDWYVEVERYDKPSADEAKKIAGKLKLEKITDSIADVQKSYNFLAAAEYVQ